MTAKFLSIKDRLALYTEISALSECWVWRGAKNQHGYGRLNVKGKPLYVQRLAWEVANGPIPTGLQILHKCDNPPCVNPKHLYVGSQSNNMKDCYLKDRHPVYAVTYEEAADIRTLYEAAIKTKPKMHVQEELSSRYKVSTRTIRMIIAKERRWPGEQTILI